MINLGALSALQLARLDAAITSIETELEDLQARGIVNASAGIDLLDLSDAVAAELEFREALDQAG